MVMFSHAGCSPAAKKPPPHPPSRGGDATGWTTRHGPRRGAACYQASEVMLWGEGDATAAAPAAIPCDKRSLRAAHGERYAAAAPAAPHSPPAAGR